MKKLWKAILVLTLALFVLIGCAMAPSGEGEISSLEATAAETALASGAMPSSLNQNETSDASPSAGAVELPEIDASVSDRDVSGEYDADQAVTLSPGGDLTITGAGVYILSGVYEDQMLVIEAGEDDKVQLVLENATLRNENGPAIYVRSADKVFITAAEGTVNTISDGSDYSLADGETTLDAAVFSREDLTLNGAGALTISGNYKHAVVSKDDLVVTAKDLTVYAANVGLNGKDSVILSGAAVTVTAGSDGIRSENGTDAAKGFVAAVDSTVTISAGKDGIQAETVFSAENAVITITSGGGSAADSGRGIKAGVGVAIGSGVYQIDASNDAIHTNGSIRISGGELTLQSRDDGIHANEKVEISGGTLNITACEGIEGTYVLLSGGDITIQASDDGVNAARKSSAYTPTVEITGGTLSVTMGAGDTDGIDSNGLILISGGTVSVNGQSAFDYDGSASLTGGAVYVNGQQVTALPNQFMGGGPGGQGGPGGPGGQGGFGGGRRR